MPSPNSATRGMTPPLSPPPLWKKAVDSFGIALAFLTCLHLPRGLFGSASNGGFGPDPGPDPGSAQFSLDAASIAGAVPWYPAVGLLLGLLGTVPLYVLSAFSGGEGQQGLAWLWAWAYILGQFCLTRGLHWDGLADMADAWGSGAQGARFWEILKDSRLGAFGSMGQILTFSGLLLACQAHVQQGQWWPLILAPCFGRFLCLGLAASTRPRDPHSLGGMACAGASPRCTWLWAFALGLLVLLYKPASLLLLLCLLACPLLFLRRMARQQGGCNGDFLGSSIVLGEFFTLIAFLL